MGFVIEGSLEVRVTVKRDGLRGLEECFCSCWKPNRFGRVLRLPFFYIKAQMI